MAMAGAGGGGALLAALLGLAAAAVLDQTALLQVTADLPTAWESRAGSQPASGAGAGGSGEDPDEMIFRRNFETAVNIMNTKRTGDKEVLANISRTLSRAWTYEVRRLVKGGVGQMLGKQQAAVNKARADAGGSADVLKAAMEEVGKYLREGRLNWDVLNWIRKMCEANAAMARKLLDKSIDWQKLATGSFFLHTDRKFSVPFARFDDPDIEMFRRGLLAAMDADGNESGGDPAAARSGVRAALDDVWREEVRRAVREQLLVRRASSANAREQISLPRLAEGDASNATATALVRWMADNTVSGRFTARALSLMGRMSRESLALARPWLEASAEWQRLERGALVALATRAVDGEGVAAGAPMLFGPEVLAGARAEVQRLLRDVAREQEELAGIELQPGELRRALHKKVRSGRLNLETLAELKVSLSDSADLAQASFDSSVDLENLVSSFLMLAFQQNGTAPQPLTADFERVLLQEQALLNVTGFAAQELLPQGRLTHESLLQLQAIAEGSVARARRWAEECAADEDLASEALAALAKRAPRPRVGGGGSGS